MKNLRDTVPDGDVQLLRARVPVCFLDAAPAGAEADREGCVLVDIEVLGGRLAAIRKSADGRPEGPVCVDLAGRQVWATLIDMHAHLDKGQVVPRVLPDGTLDGGSRLTAQDRRHWSPDDIAARMRFGLCCAHVHGVSAIRTHLDSHEGMAEQSWEVFRELRAEWSGRITLQAVSIGPLAVFRTDWGRHLADLVATSGGVLGGVTDALGNYQGAIDETLDATLDAFLGIAAERGLDVDLHVDQTDDLALFALPNIARAVIRTRFKGRVVCGHCVNLALQPESVIAETIGLAAEAGLSFVTLPIPMMYLQDRRPGRTPRWRGVTAVSELQAAGLPVAVAGDNCRDAWYPFGDHDMLDTLQQSVRILQLDDPVSAALAMAGPVPAAIIREPALGRLAVGEPANLILLAARSLNEAMCRPQADRIVIKAGRQVTDALPDYRDLDAVLAKAPSD